MVRLLSSTLMVLVVAALAVAATGCNSAPTSPTTAPFSAIDIRVGTGATATTGNTISVNYIGWLYNAAAPDQKGLVFDTSAIRNTPFTFSLGTGQVIAGWDQGITGMQVGGLRRLVIPPNMGYGSVRVGAIPPYSTLIFDVELVSIQ